VGDRAVIDENLRTLPYPVQIVTLAGAQGAGGGAGQ
jgi:hypothetical protein